MTRKLSSCYPSNSKSSLSYDISRNDSATRYAEISHLFSSSRLSSSDFYLSHMPKRRTSLKRVSVRHSIVILLIIYSTIRWKKLWNTMSSWLNWNWWIIQKAMKYFSCWDIKVKNKRPCQWYLSVLLVNTKISEVITVRCHSGDHDKLIWLTARSCVKRCLEILFSQALLEKAKVIQMNSTHGREKLNSMQKMILLCCNDSLELFFREIIRIRMFSSFLLICLEIHSQHVESCKSGHIWLIQASDQFRATYKELPDIENNNRDWEG